MGPIFYQCNATGHGAPFQQYYWLIGPMGSPRPRPEKKGREAAASRGWMRFRRERRAGAAIFGQTEVVHSTKMLPLLHFRPLRPADLVAAREGRANATRRRARGRRASSRCSITQSARLPSARRRSQRPSRWSFASSQGAQHWRAKGSKAQRREGLGSKSSSANQAAQAATKGAGYESRRCFALLLFCFALAHCL